MTTTRYSVDRLAAGTRVYVLMRVVGVTRNGDGIVRPCCVPFRCWLNQYWELGVVPVVNPTAWSMGWPLSVEHHQLRACRPVTSGAKKSSKSPSANVPPNHPVCWIVLSKRTVI